MIRRLYCVTFLIAAVAIAGCGSNETKTAATTAKPKTAEVMKPFRFHKMIEVSPGQTYDVLSWGRGSQEAGAFMILHSDSSAIKYTTTTGDLDGRIIDVYNSDMDVDGNPEILIAVKSRDTINRTGIYGFEYSNDNSKPNKLDFPKLNSSQRKGYRGEDNFYIRDGKLIREFPIYKGSGKDATSTGAKRQLEYGLSRNEFTVKQLSKDSVDVADKTTASQTQPKEPEVKKSTSKSEKQSSSQSSSKKKSKHNRHRN